MSEKVQNDGTPMRRFVYVAAFLNDRCILEFRSTELWARDAADCEARGYERLEDLPRRAMLINDYAHEVKL